MATQFLDEGAEFDRATEQPPFSNGFEGDVWMTNWCQRCVHENACPLILVAVLGRTPHAWREVDPMSLANRYTCESWLPA